MAFLPIGRTQAVIVHKSRDSIRKEVISVWYSAGPNDVRPSYETPVKLMQCRSSSQ